MFYEPLRIPCIVILCCVVWFYRLYGKRSGISAWNAVFYPFGAMLFIVALMRSMIVTLVQGGVRWRGTFYSLKELKTSSTPLRWR